MIRSRARLLALGALVAAAARAPRAGRVARSLARAFLVSLALGGIPGSSARPVLRDLSAPALPPPAELAHRDAALIVTVRDRGGASRPGANVRALAMMEDRAYFAGAGQTDAAGQVHLTHLPRGELWVLADAPQRARGSTHVVLGSEPRDVVLELAPENTLGVVVTEDQGAPVQGAQIEALASDALLPVGALTGAEGFARVARLGAGPWKVAVRATGYEDATGRAVQNGETVRVMLRKLSALTVRVVGPDDKPVAGARVMAAGATLWPARAAETSVGGEVRIEGLTAGAYALRATRGDLVSSVEIGLALARGEEKTLVLRLFPGTSIGVRVIDGGAADGPPVAGARVLLVEGGISPFPLEAKTDSHGRARLGPMAPGLATLGVTADGFVPRGAIPLADPLPAETQVALVRSGTLTGRVTDVRGYPVAGATIEIVGSDASGGPILDDPRRASFQSAHFDAVLAGPAPFSAAGGELGVVPGPIPPIPLSRFAPLAPASAIAGLRSSMASEPWVTRGDGTFRASPASPGRVRAIVRHPQYVEAESPVVTLLSGGEAQVDMVLHEGGSLEGRVVDVDERPVRGARVFVAGTRGSVERMTRTASDGTFAFAALPEAVTLTVSADEDEQPDVRMELAIPEGERKDVTVRLPASRAALAVTVVDSRERAVAAVQLSASSLAAEVPLRATAFTDARGEAVLKRAAGLPVRIEATAPGYAPFVLTTDGSAGVVHIELAPAESATGEVVAAGSGEPVARADVSLSTYLGVRHARTDGRGLFAIAGLAPGPATLLVRAPAFAPHSATVSIDDNGGRRAFAIPRVELTSEGRVEGEVIDRRGDPVPGARVAKDHVPTWLLVGSNPRGIAVADARGRFALGELPEGATSLEAYAPDIGRARVDGLRVVAGRATVGVRLMLAAGASDDENPTQPPTSGNVAITLGQTTAPAQVVIVSVVEGSEAERSGLAASDVVLAVDGAAVRSIEDARAKLSGPTADDVLVQVRRADRTMTMRVAREAVRR